MDKESETALSDVNKLITKNYRLISKISRVQGKHMVIEIVEGQFKMNEFSCNDLLRKVRDSYDVSDSKCDGAISYRDCKMMLSDVEFVHNIDTRFECILVRLFPLSCIILKNSVLVVVNENMKMDGFIKDLCRITQYYSRFNSDNTSNRTVPGSETSQNSSEQSLVGSEESQNTFNFKLPFEICVLECCFITALSHLESDLIVFEDKNKILEDKVYNNKKFKDISIILHDLKHPVSNMNEMSRGFEDLINEILNCDENIKVLEFSNHILHYGSETMRNNLSYRPVNHDLQFLLEYFDQEIEMLCKRARTLDNSLVHIERYINLELAITRNEMMRLDVMCSILGVSFGVGACLSGLFGMNVINGLEQSRYAFTSITLAFLSVLFVALYVTRVLQVKHRENSVFLLKIWMLVYSIILHIVLRSVVFNLIFNFSNTFLLNSRTKMINSLNIKSYFGKQTHKPSSDSFPEDSENTKTPARLFNSGTNENANKNLKDLFTDSSVEEITASEFRRAVMKNVEPKNDAEDKTNDTSFHTKDETKLIKMEPSDDKNEMKLMKMDQDDVKNDLKMEKKVMKKEFDDEPAVGSLFNIYIKKSDSNDDITSSRFDPALFDITPYFPSTMCGKPNNSILFSLVSNVLQKSDDIFCTGKGSRKSVLTLLSNFYRILIYYNPPDVIPVTYLLLNRIYPEYENIEIGVGDSLIMKSMSEAYSKSEQNIKSMLKKYEDLGLVAAASSCTSQLLFKLPENTISGVFNHFRSIASVTGKNSNNNKKEIIKKLLITAKKVEAKYIIRSLQQRLRIGIGLNTIFQCIADAFYLTRPGTVNPVKVGENTGKALSNPIGDVRTEKGSPPKYTIEDMEFSVKTAITMLPNIEKVVGHLLDNDDSEQLVEHCKITPGIPVRPMLAKPVNDQSEILQALGGDDVTFTCEYKYDGERVQIHLLKDKSIKLFSRNMENLMEKYPDVVEHFKKSIKPDLEECIIDCEVVPIDDENKLLSFQSLSTRKRKDVDPNNVSVRVCLFLFDILYLNGESLVTEPLSKRREHLYNSLNTIPGTVVFAENRNFQSIEHIDDFLKSALQDSCEGLMIKTLDDKATYEPQARSNKWLKYKKDYITGLADSVDLVPIGAFFGKGKRLSVFGSYLLAVYDPMQEVYQALCKTGTGFTDQVLKDLHDSLQKDITTTKPSFYDVSEKMEPDVWFLPKKVWECKAADLSLSPVYTAANRLNPNEKGIGLRFPRFLRVREDKKPEEATTSDQIFDMYMSQFNK